MTIPNDVLVNLTQVPNASPISENKIPRKPQYLFGNTGTVGVFSSAASGTPTVTTDIETMQSLAGWNEGNASMLIGESNVPIVEEMNTPLAVFSQQIAEIFQDGGLPWEVNTPYFINSPATDGNGNRYISLTGVDGAPNVGNPLTSTTDWAFVSNDALQNKLTSSLGNTGVLRDTPITVTTPTQSTVQISAISSVRFVSLAASGKDPVISLPQTTFNVTTLNSMLLTNGLYSGYLAYDNTGALSFLITLQNPTKDYFRVCKINLKRVGGVVSLLYTLPVTGINKNIWVMPYLVDSGTLARVTGTVGQVTFVKNPNLTFGITAGSLIREGINFSISPDFNPSKLSLAPQTTQSFLRASTATNTSTTPPATFTTIDPANYDKNGVITAVGTNNASVQRVLVSETGQFAVQYGTVVYSDGNADASFQDAVNNMSGQIFPNIISAESYVEVARIAMKQNATNLTNVTQAIWQLQNGSASSTSGGGAGVFGSITVTGATNLSDLAPYAVVTTLADPNNTLIGVTGSANRFLMSKGTGSSPEFEVIDPSVQHPITTTPSCIAGTIPSSPNNMNIYGVPAGGVSNYGYSELVVTYNTWNPAQATFSLRFKAWQSSSWNQNNGTLSLFAGTPTGVYANCFQIYPTYNVNGTNYSAKPGANWVRNDCQINGNGNQSNFNPKSCSIKKTPGAFGSGSSGLDIIFNNSTGWWMIEIDNNSWGWLDVTIEWQNF